MSGEYTGGQKESLTVTLTGCKRAGEACSSLGAGAGEIVSSALEGEVGFISGRATKKPVIGLDLKREVALLTATCGSGLTKTVLTVEGSVIGAIKPTAKMTLEETLKFTASAGRQAPESFQEGEADTLVESLLTGAQKTSEPAGLTATVKLKSEEPMEIKTRVV